MFLRNLCLLVVLSRGAVCYPDGAPIGACAHMRPNHGPDAVESRDQGDLHLFAQLHEKGSAKVLLNGTFKGFLIKAVNKDGAVHGKFTTDKPAVAKAIDCDGQKDSAVTHVSNVDKSSVDVTWTALDAFSGDVMFRATVVRTKNDYFRSLESASLKIEASTTDDSGKRDKDGKAEKPNSSTTSRSELAAWPLVLVFGCLVLNAQRHRLAFL